MSRRRSRAHGLRPKAQDGEQRSVVAKPAPRSAETAEDSVLWSVVARSIDRVTLKGRAMRSTATPGESSPSAAPASPPAVSRRPAPSSAPPLVQPPEHAHTPARSKPPPDTSQFDRRKARRIATGRVDLDARLDLHGLTEARAHGALRHFLHACHHRGHRTVLVITGKGGSPLDQGRMREDGTERGVLRRNVPRWLAEPDMAPLVVSFTTAAQRHGGDGAIYVHLRGRRG